MPSKVKRVRVEPGIYRRGDTYEIRVSGPTVGGKRCSRWQTIGTSKREARRALTAQRAAALSPTAASVNARLTLGDFLNDHYRPHLDDRVARGTMTLTTANKYRSYIPRVVSQLGAQRVAALTTVDVEGVYADLHSGGRHPDAGIGRPRTRPAFVYDFVAEKRAEGWPFSDIATLLVSRHPAEAAGLTRHAVAAIHRRSLAKPVVAEATSALSAVTVRKVAAMLRSAWAYGVKAGLIARDRSHIVAEADVPQDPKRRADDVTVHWNDHQYGAFFDWAVRNRTERTWVLLLFVASSGERISANLGFRWDDIDLTAKTAEIRRYVKYNTGRGPRVLVEPFGKTSAGHTLHLDNYTVQALTTWRATQREEIVGAGGGHTCAVEGRACPQPGYHNRNLVFAQADGNYRDPNKVLDLFQDAIRGYNADHRSAPLPLIGLHGLRHGWSSIAEDEEITPAVRMERLDQRSLRTNRRYSHAQQKAMQAASQAVADRLFGGSVALGQLRAVL